jgi:hypothetical protein
VNCDTDDKRRSTIVFRQPMRFECSIVCDYLTDDSFDTRLVSSVSRSRELANVSKKRNGETDGETE